MSVRVVATTPDDLKWPHRIDSGDRPVYRCKAGTYEREFAVDPHPAYQADVKLVEQLVDECADRFPLNGADLNVYVLSHEFLSRVNGLTIYGTVYYDDKGNRIEIPIKGGPNDEERKFGGIAHLIVLSAKRIPIHPAFLRYLVAHEYGHCAFNHVRRRLGYLDHEDGKLEEEYLKIRGCKPSGSDKSHARDAQGGGVLAARGAAGRGPEPDLGVVAEGARAVRAGGTMKAKITRPDGTVIEIEGTADEVDRVVNPNVIRWPWSVPAIPFPNVPNIPGPYQIGGFSGEIGTIGSGTSSARR